MIEPGLPQLAGCAAGCNQLHFFVVQALRQLNKTGFIGDRQESFHG